MKKLSKINQEILTLTQKVEKWFSEDHTKKFHIREGYICAKIKNYEYLENHHIDEILETKNLSPNQTHIIKKEFEDKLWSIVNMTNAQNISSFKECCFNWEGNQEEKEKTQLGYHLYNITADSDNMWQFGRSGGYLSLARESAIEFEGNIDVSILCYNISEHYEESMSNEEFNTLLHESIFFEYGKTKQSCLAAIKKEFKEISDLVDSYLFVKDYIEDAAKNMLPLYKEQLRIDIEDVLENEEIASADIDEWLRVNKATAIKLFQESKYELCYLYDDGSEKMIQELSEIEQEEDDINNVFGIRLDEVIHRYQDRY